MYDIYIKESMSCTQLDNDYDSEIQTIKQQITQLNRYLFDEKNPLVMEKIVIISGTTLNAFQGKNLDSQDIQPPNILGYKNVGLLGG